MNRKVVSMTIAVMLGLSSFYIASATHVDAAVSNHDIQNKKSEMNSVKQKRSSVQSQISQSENQITTLKNQQADVVTEIQKYNASIEEATNSIHEKEAKIEKTKADIEDLKAKIAVVKERIKQRNELLKERIRSLQLSGGMVSYLEVLLGSQSFGDFVNRMTAVSTIMEADKTILKEHEADKKLKEDEENKLNENLQSVQDDLADLQKMKASYEQQVTERNKLLGQLKEKQTHAEKEQMALEEQNQILGSQESAMKQQLKLLQDQKERESQQQQSQNHTTSGSNQTIPASSGMFTRPTTGIITTGFEYRWGEFHPGVDIANSAGTQVVAAADGVVFRSYTSSSYGNCIFVTHNINGQVYTTVYAHLSQRLASDGQIVHRGDLIGYMGSTGESTGNHLHFEIHKGTWNYAKSNAVNPLSYVSF